MRIHEPISLFYTGRLRIYVHHVAASDFPLWQDEVLRGAPRHECVMKSVMAGLVR